VKLPHRVNDPVGEMFISTTRANIIEREREKERKKKREREQERQ
jgi:hypothetical protein